MVLNELYMKIFILMMCLNGGILIVDSLVDIPLITPFDINETVTGVDNPVYQSYDPENQTGTLVGNITGNDLTNATLGGNNDPIPAYNIFNSLAVVWAYLSFIINAATGGFVFQVLGIFGFPAVFVYVLQGIFGILVARMIIYYLTGR